MSRRPELATSGVMVAGFVASAVVGLAYPRHMIGAASWSITVAVVLYGLGSAVGRATRIELQSSERIVLGTGLWIAVTGWLLAIGQASRIALLVVAALGFASTLVELVRRDRPSAPPRLESGDRFASVTLWILLSILLALNLLGMIGTRGNPADDQAAYTALVKRVLDCGDLIEPFSLRRLSAYGGQTMLHALAALRGDVAALDLLDRGIFHWIAVFAVIDLARRRRLHLAITVVLVVFLVSLWDIQLNSGAVWTGFTCFLAAYGFASRDDLAPRAKLALALAMLGAACTLRQNYLLPAGLFGLLLVVSHLRDAAASSSWPRAWTAERRTALIAIAAAAVVVVPYMIAAFASSGTPLYPIALGTANPALPLRPTAGTLLDEISLFISVAFTPEPIHVWWLLLPIMLLAKDRRPLRPWRAFLVAGFVGFVVLVHSFMLSDAWNLWRYAFGYLTPLAIVLALEVAAELPVGERDQRARLGVPVVATYLVWLALVLNLVETRTATARRFGATLQNIKVAWRFGSAKQEPRLRSYADLQRSVPEGATLAVLLDDPWMLDYARNRIVNLDLPGCAAPAPGLPSFTEPEHWRSYLVSRGIRYVAFIDPDYSAFLYRRRNWLGRMFVDDELFQFIAAHNVDAFDSLRALARRSQVVFERDAMSVIDLGATAGPEPDRGPPELTRMDRFIAQISQHELGHQAWQLARRSTVVFKASGTEVGAGPQSVVPWSADQPGTSGLSTLLAALQERPHRWLSDRTLVRVFGTGRERVHAKLWLELGAASNVPTVSFSIDGAIIAEAAPGRDGYIVVDAPAPCTGWCDLYIVFNSIFDWSPSATGIAKLLELDWTAR